LCVPTLALLPLSVGVVVFAPGRHVRWCCHPLLFSLLTPLIPPSDTTRPYCSVRRHPVLARPLQDRLGIDDSALGGGMPMMNPAMFAGAAPAAAAEEAPAAAAEKTAFDIKLVSFEAAKKIGVIKEVRALTSLGLKEAKALVEEAPKVFMTGVAKAEAEGIRDKIEGLGGKVELE